LVASWELILAGEGFGQRPPAKQAGCREQETDTPRTVALVFIHEQQLGADEIASPEGCQLFLRSGGAARLKSAEKLGVQKMPNTCR
jgi:hypothetical protein